jgi:hypothetical protein
VAVGVLLDAQSFKFGRVPERSSEAFMISQALINASSALNH